jgi:hypothetical protein
MRTGIGESFGFVTGKYVGVAAATPRTFSRLTEMMPDADWYAIYGSLCVRENTRCTVEGDDSTLHGTVVTYAVVGSTSSVGSDE